jgi:hypothetical protein
MSGHLALTFIDYAGLNAQHNFNREIKTSFSVENILQTILQKKYTTNKGYCRKRTCLIFYSINIIFEISFKYRLLHVSTNRPFA